MQCEQNRREKSAGDREAAKDHRDETGRRRVKGDVDEMVAEGRIAPETMHEPEGRMRDGVILLCRADVEPDAPQSGGRLEVGPRQMCVVVPQHPAVPRRMVRDQRRGYQDET